MFYIVSLFWILSITGLLVLITKRKFETMLPLTFIGGAFLLYIFGFVNHISYGYYSSWLFIIVFFILLIKKKNKKEFVNNYFTVGFIVFIIFIILIFIKNMYTGFTYCDEFMHWGPMVKEMFRLDKFYLVGESQLLVHKDYPPFFALVELLFCRFGNCFKENYLYIGLESFSLSLFIPLYSNITRINKTNLFKGIIMGVAIVLSCLTISITQTMVDKSLLFNSIYVDYPMALLTAFSLFFVYSTLDWDKFNAIYLSSFLCSLVLTKQMGLPFYLVVLLVWILKVACFDKKKIKFTHLLFFIIIPIIVYLSWKIAVKFYNTDMQFNLNSFNITELKDFIIGNNRPEYRIETFINFKYNILYRKLVLNPIELTYFECVLLVIVILMIFTKERIKSLIISIGYGIGAIGYAFAMLFLYTFMFSYEEAIELASFDRYMGTYLFLGFIVLFMIIFNEINKQNKAIWYQLVLLLITLLFVEPASYETLTINTELKDTSDKKVLLIRQFWTGDKYEREVNNGFTIDIVNRDHLCTYDDDETMKKEVEKFYSELKSYNYLYVKAYDGDFDKYWNEISNGELLYNGNLYEICVENDKIELKDLNYSPIYFVIKYYEMTD